MTVPEYSCMEISFGRVAAVGANTYAAVNFLGSTKGQFDTRRTKQRRAGTRIDAQVKVDIGAILVGASQTALGAERVTRSRAEVGDLDDDGLRACKGVAARVGGWSQLVAGTASWTGAGARSNSEQVLRCGSTVTRGSVEATGSGGGVAVSGSEGVTGTVLGEGGLVALSGSETERRGGDEECVGVHLDLG